MFLGIVPNIVVHVKILDTVYTVRSNDITELLIWQVALDMIDDTIHSITSIFGMLCIYREQAHMYIIFYTTLINNEVLAFRDS